MTRLVLFDFDGTLVDSTPGICSSVRAAAAELGLPDPSPAQLRAMVGRAPVLVGDRAHDVRGAAVHGLPCIGAGWGPAEDGELERAGAAVVVATPAEVPAALAALAPGG